MLRVVLIAIAVLLALYLSALVFLFRYVAVRRRKPRPLAVPESEKGPWSKYAAAVNREVRWFLAQGPERVGIRGRDGKKLAGLYLPAENSKGTLLLMHGYRSSPYHDFSCAFRLYHGLGYNLLTVFQRSHGESEGRYICFGVKERFDCLDWCDYINKRNGGEADLFLAGLSMGCATVLMASGLRLPPNVRGIVADCGFTSPWDELRYLVKERMHLPVHPLLDGVNVLFRVFAGFGLKDCSTPDALAKNKIPVLFFHGGRDRFVPTRMSLQNFEACAAPKELVIAEDAGHGDSYMLETERYTAAVKAFLARCGTEAKPGQP